MALSWLKKDTVKLVVHIILATAVLIMGIVEFSVQPPLFDVAGDRIGIKDHVFKVLCAPQACYRVVLVTY
jgi:fucose permease